MSVRDSILSRRQDILAAARRRGAASVSLFGSIARGEDDDKSDADFLVEMEPGRSLFDLGGLQMDLQELLGRPVDVITKRGLRPRFRETVLREAVPL